MTQYMYVKRLVLAVTVFGIITFAAGTAKADIVVIQGVNNQGTDNVLLNDATDVMTVTGTAGQNALVVNFVSSSGSMLLNADASGQAMITGGTGNVNFTNISFSLADNGTFTRAVFNLNSNNNGSIQITVTGINIDGGVFSDTFEVNANGQNFFTVTAINGQLIQNIDITALGGVTFEDLRQVRLGGGDVVETPIPEPATMLLLGTGLIGVAASVRRRLRKS